MYFLKKIKKIKQIINRKNNIYHTDKNINVFLIFAELQ